MSRKKSRVELREEIFGENKAVLLPVDLAALAIELEQIYNKLDLLGATPSELYERLLRLIQEENEIVSRSDFDDSYRCPSCHRR